jgi:hypothetical protein
MVREDWNADDEEADDQAETTYELALHVTPLDAVARKP